MSIPLPHPDRAAVDAAGNAMLALVAAARNLPVDDVPKLSTLPPVERHIARSRALDVLTPAAPAIALATARALAADLDTAGEHSAATRIHTTIAEWTAASATIPDDLSGLLP